MRENEDVDPLGVLIKDYVKYTYLNMHGTPIGSQAEGIWDEIMSMVSEKERPMVINEITQAVIDYRP